MAAFYQCYGSLSFVERFVGCIPLNHIPCKRNTVYAFCIQNRIVERIERIVLNPDIAMERILRIGLGNFRLDRYDGFTKLIHGRHTGITEVVSFNKHIFYRTRFVPIIRIARNQYSRPARLEHIVFNHYFSRCGNQ